MLRIMARLCFIALAILALIAMLIPTFCLNETEIVLPQAESAAMRSGQKKFSENRGRCGFDEGTEAQVACRGSRVAPLKILWELQKPTTTLSSLSRPNSPLQNASALSSAHEGGIGRQNVGWPQGFPTALRRDLAGNSLG